MAGKSTILRSLTSVALLSQCGLMVPARECTLCQDLDSITLRMASDSPSEGLSGFAVEMMEIKCVMEESSSSSLFAWMSLEEGTEATHGTAIAAAVIEKLDHLGCRVFSPLIFTASWTVICICRHSQRTCVWEQQ